MNQTQLKHVRERASAIYRRRKATLEARPKGLTKEERLAALVAGRFTVNPDCTGYHWENAVEFTDEPVFDAAGAKAAVAALDAEYGVLMDELILGDNAQALALLRAFEAA